MISCSRSATADTVIGVFGNVVDHMPAYFGDQVEDQTTCHSSVIALRLETSLWMDASNWAS